MPEKKLYDWLYSRTWLRQKCQYSLSLARPLGARCGPLFLQSGHSHIAASSRAAACCFALSLLGLMRMESKNLDESIGMSDYDNATAKASSLDIANISLLFAIDEARSRSYCRRHGHRQRHYHKQVARSFLAGKPRRLGRITSA